MAGDNRSGMPRARGQRGFTMLEILITLFLLTMWLLASAGVQSSSLQFTKAAQFRTQAVYLATELAERMQANPTAAVKGTYAKTLAATNCVNATCAADDLAAFDLAETNGRLTAALPSGASVTVSTCAPADTITNPITYTILVCWSDRRTDRTYAASGTAAASTCSAPACPAVAEGSESFSYTTTKTIFNPPS